MVSKAEKRILIQERLKAASKKKPAKKDTQKETPKKDSKLE
tara:strand:+ start:1000 stop:1122 length:123 start_codon:yes stop_codon:yes gene_type:complete